MIKKPSPVSNLSFLSKVIEKVISIRILGHILDNNIVDSFQSAYRAGHSCETALLRVYNDIVTTVGKGNGSFLVFLDLSAAVDTIDHDNLFYILERYVGIGGSALRLIRSYFSDRTQRVQFDGISSDFASLLCGVPQGSVRDLGVVFDQYLTFHDHISGICKSTHFHLRGIGRIRNLLTFDATAQLIHALITSRLDFCNSILYNLPNKQIERLQRIQNQAARMLKRIPRRNHITPVLRELHWLRIHDRIIFKVCF